MLRVNVDGGMDLVEFVPGGVPSKSLFRCSSCGRGPKQLTQQHAFSTATHAYAFFYANKQNHAWGCRAAVHLYAAPLRRSRPKSWQPKGAPLVLVKRSLKRCKPRIEAREFVDITEAVFCNVEDPPVRAEPIVQGDVQRIRTELRARLEAHFAP